VLLSRFVFEQSYRTAPASHLPRRPPAFEQFGDFEENTWTPVSGLLVPKNPTGEQPLEAQLSGAIAQHGVET
jgi:hypothetical protein